MKKEKAIKISYKFIINDKQELGIEQAFDILFEEVLKDEKTSDSKTKHKKSIAIGIQSNIN